MSTLDFVVAGALDQPTGGYRYDRCLIDALRALGHTVTVHELPGRFPRADEAATRALEQTLARCADDAVVVVDGLVCGDLPEPMERHAGRLALVVLVHHPLCDETGLATAESARLKTREARSLAAAQRIVTTSGFTAARLNALGLTDRLATVVEPGVAVAPPRPARSAGPCRLLCVATLVPRKGHATLVAALARIAELDWRCDCVGDTRRDPAHAQAIQAAIDAAGLSGRVRLHGALSDAELERAYARSDLFVLASHYEGYGMVVTEAIAHGLPVVTTTGGALADTLPAGTGEAVDSNDAPALAEALRALMVDPERRAALRRAVLSARDALRSWPGVAREFAEVIASTPSVRRS